MAGADDWILPSLTTTASGPQCAAVMMVCPSLTVSAKTRVLKAGATSTPPMVAPVLRKLRRLVRYVVVMVGLP